MDDVHVHGECTRNVVCWADGILMVAAQYHLRVVHQHEDEDYESYSGHHQLHDSVREAVQLHEEEDGGPDCRDGTYDKEEHGVDAPPSCHVEPRLEGEGGEEQQDKEGGAERKNDCPLIVIDLSSTDGKG